MKAKIYYRDIGDYLTREQKLKILRDTKSIENLEMTELHPNDEGDWISQRNDEFAEYIAIAPEKKFDVKAAAVFNTFAIGVATNRDVWVYGFSKNEVSKNMQNMIAFYNEQSEKLKKGKIKEIEYNESLISWTRSLKKDAGKNIIHKFEESEFCESIYRPFCKLNLYYHKPFIESPGLWKQLFPTSNHKNLVICIQAPGGTKDLSVLIVGTLCDLHFTGDTQCFPLYYYEENKNDFHDLFAENANEKYIRHDGITDWILSQARSHYGKSVSKEDIFYYVYGFLHSKEYREKYAADLKKMLPRIPLVEKKEDFYSFSNAGRALANLHLNYENVPAYDGVILETIKPVVYEKSSEKPKLNLGYGEVMAAEPSPKFTNNFDEYKYYAVEKMRFPQKGQKDTIDYNHYVTIKNIPAKAYDYIVNGKSAIEWIMERYCVSTDKASGIKNDCNDWAREHEKPRYVLDLLLSVINVSVQTVEIVEGLPKVEF